MTDILLIEDNMDLGTVLRDFLINEEYRVFYAQSGEEGLAFLEKEQAKIILLDIMLPGMDGFEVCEKIRKNSNIPIIIISAKLSKDDKMNGLLLGADDYIEKPYDIDILLAKIGAVYRRNYGNGSLGMVIEEGNMKMDLEARTVYCDDKLISLTIKEFELLHLFLKNKGKVLKKEWIFNQIWGVGSFSEASTLTVHIKWLREKIEDNPREPRHLITVWGVGYKFV